MKSSIKKLTLAVSASTLLWSMSGCSVFQPVGVTSNPVSVMSKQGEGCARSILFGLIPISVDHNLVYHSAIDHYKFFKRA